MTRAEPQHAPPKRTPAPWHAFRHWRRTRPFWGGLLTALAGLEIFGTTQMSLAGLAFQMGPTGFLSWLVPTILVTCGLLMWFTLQHRILYAVVAAVTTLFSLIGVNLGGFFIGLLLGLLGSALGFAWTPDVTPNGALRYEPAGDWAAPDEAAGQGTARDESVSDGTAGDEATLHRTVREEAADDDATPGDQTPDDGTRRDELSPGAKADLPAPDAARSAGRPSSTS